MMLLVSPVLLDNIAWLVAVRTGDHILEVESWQT